MENEHLSLMLFMVVAVIYCLIYMTKNCFSAAMVLLVSEGVLTKTQTGNISAMFYLIYAPFQIVGGLAADRFSPYKLIAIGPLMLQFSLACGLQFLRSFPQCSHLYTGTMQCST